MGKGQSRRSSDNLIAHYSEVIERQRKTSVKLAHIPEDEQKPGTWRTDLIESLTQRRFEEPESTWIPAIIDGVFAWDMSLDMRWRENVKWFVTIPSAFTEEKRSEACCVWAIPGIANANIFQADCLTDFFEEHLNHSDSHAIARLIEIFCERFVQVYSSQITCCTLTTPLAEAMKADILDFSESITDALQRYYSPINIRKLLRKPESYLTFIVRKKILQNEAVFDVLFQGIAMGMVDFEEKYREKVKMHRGIELASITTQVTPELIEVAQMPAGFSEAISMLSALTLPLPLQDKLTAIYRLTEATTLAVDRVKKGNKSITLTADDMVALFALFVLRAGVFDLASHLDLIESIVPFDQMDNLVGFSLTSLQAAVQHITTAM